LGSHAVPGTAPGPGAGRTCRIPARESVVRKRKADAEPPSPIRADGSYNPDEFIIPGQDERGHSVRETIRVSSELERDIDIIVQSRHFPYKTKGDLLRHAVVRHLEWLHVLEPGFPTHLLSAHLAQLDMLREEEMSLTSHQVFKRLHDQVEAYLASGEPGEARRVAATTISRLRGVADSAWKRRFESRFLRQYAALLNGEPVMMAGGE